MKKLFVITAILAMLAACGAAPGPRATVEKAFKAMQNADGKALLECLSSEAVAELNESIQEMKETPEESAMMMAFLGLEVTADEIRNLDAAGFITLLLKSDMFSAEVANMNITYGAERIDGNKAWVEVTMNGMTDEIQLVNENGRWVMDEGFDMF
jgi:hypothetical protein